MKRSSHLSAPSVTAKLMRRIEGGHFRPGERVIPKDIARDLGGSPIPVREALCQLVGRGIVLEQRNKGFTIAPMTSATLRALYVAHGKIIETAFAQWPPSQPLSPPSRHPWPTFAALVRRANDDALIGVQHYLAGRLAVARTFEERWFKAGGRDRNVTDALRQGDRARAEAVIRGFHEECVQASSDIWHLLSDR